MPVTVGSISISILRRRRHLPSKAYLYYQQQFFLNIFEPSFSCKQALVLIDSKSIYLSTTMGGIFTLHGVAKSIIFQPKNWLQTNDKKRRTLVLFRKGYPLWAIFVISEQSGVSGVHPSIIPSAPSPPVNHCLDTFLGSQESMQMSHRDRSSLPTATSYIP